MATAPKSATDVFISVPLVTSVNALPRLLRLDPPLTDEEFESLAERTEMVKLERAKDGTIIVNPPTGQDSSSANSEIARQLKNWWREHRKGRVFDSSGGFYLSTELSDRSSSSPDAAYATAEQVKGRSREDRRHFGRFVPAFVIELLSASDHLPKGQEKMEQWLAYGAQLGWLIDPYERNVWVYEAGREPRLETADRVIGTGPVDGFVLELSDVWSEYK